MGFLPIPVESSYGNMYVCELCDQASVLLEDCLLGGEDDSFFLRSTSQKFGSSLHLGQGVRSKEDWECVAGSRGVVGSRVGNRRTPLGDTLKEEFRGLLERHPSCSLPL